jgi:hypothetical protein
LICIQKFMRKGRCLWRLPSYGCKPTNGSAGNSSIQLQVERNGMNQDVKSVPLLLNEKSSLRWTANRLWNGHRCRCFRHQNS